MSFNFEVEAGKSVKLTTAGKYCDRDIVVSATGGGGYTEEDLQAKYNEGKQAEHDRFWDAVQKNGLQGGADYEYRFFNFPADLFEPKYDFVFSVSTYSANSTFRKTTITDLKKNCDFSTLATAYGLQYTCLECKQLVNARTFTVRAETKFTSVFGRCDALEEIRFNGVIGQNGLSFKDSHKLSKASIESVIEHLSTTTSGLSVTFSATAVSNAFTDTEWATLANTRSNWTINLV
jgi:hypothetical protein